MKLWGQGWMSWLGMRSMPLLCPLSSAETSPLPERGCSSYLWTLRATLYQNPPSWFHMLWDCPYPHPGGQWAVKDTKGSLLNLSPSLQPAVVM